MKYNHGPTDDAIYRLQPTITGTAEDPDYPGTNWYDLNPAKPGKLTGTSGTWTFVFSAPITINAFALVYSNGTSVSLSGGSAHALTNASLGEDNWPKNNPYVEVTDTATTWTLTIGGSLDGNPISIGRPVFSLNLRTMTRDLLWTEAIPETEEWGLIEQRTDLGVETVYPLGGKRRSLIANIGGNSTQAQAIQALRRAVQGRAYPFLAIPPHVTNDAWFVRFEDGMGQINYKLPAYNTAPFTIKELSRGLPWP